MCGGVEYRVSCLSVNPKLKLKELIGLPVEIQFVTDKGGLRSVCGLVADASAGECDGAVASYRITVRDAMSIMENRTNTRVFMGASELDIIKIILDEWRRSCWAMTAAFEYEFDAQFQQHPFPVREFVMQYNESDAAFIRRLLKRRGIAWYFRPGRSKLTGVDPQHDDVPAHTLVLFYSTDRLPQNAAGTVRYDNEHAATQRDTVTGWAKQRTLRPGSIGRYSWDFQLPQGTPFMMTGASSKLAQGSIGNGLVATLNDYQIDVPSAAANSEDQAQLGQLRMRRHDYESKCYHGEGPLSGFCTGTYFSLAGHNEIDSHPAEEREFVIIALQITALNNLPSEVASKAQQLFARSGWAGEPTNTRARPDDAAKLAASPARVRVQFAAVRRDVAIVPAFDRRIDLPRTELQSAIVVGPAGEEVHCDELGRVMVRFTGTLEKDHAHADGAGAAGCHGDSWWIRVASHWAGHAAYSGAAGLPGVGTEVLIGFLGGDPDRPIILGQLHNSDARPPTFSAGGVLPGTRYVSGTRTHEIRGVRGNQLRFDDTTGQISAQLASDHGATQLNLGLLTEPRDRHGRSDTRGEGAELRTDKAVAVRGGQGVLISAEASVEAEGTHLERAGLVGLAAMLQSVANDLATLAKTHAGDEATAPQLSSLVNKLKQWNSGASVAAAAPIVAVSAPAGMVLGSQENIVMGAETRIDVLCAGDTSLATGKNLFMRAARSISLCAFKLGIKLIAARGDVIVQTHEGNVSIKSSRRITLDAAEDIDLRAPEIKVLGQGAQTDWGNGAITEQCTGAYAVKSATFARIGPEGASPPGLVFPTTQMKAHGRVVVLDRQTLLPVKGQAYTAKREDGRSVQGATDDQGRTTLIKSDEISDLGLTIHQAHPGAAPSKEED